MNRQTINVLKVRKQISVQLVRTLMELYVGLCFAKTKTTKTSQKQPFSKTQTTKQNLTNESRQQGLEESVLVVHKQGNVVAHLRIESLVPLFLKC
jgi:hypothetical protein